MRNQEGLNQFLAGSLLEIKLRNQQSKVVRVIQIRSCYDRFHLIHRVRQFAYLRRQVVEVKLIQDVDDSLFN